MSGEPCTPEEFWAPEEAGVEEPPEGMWATPEQWVGKFLRGTREERLRTAERTLWLATEADRCWGEQHTARLTYLNARVLDLVRENNNLLDRLGAHTMQ